MVKSKMENRMDNVEREMSTVKDDIGTLKIDMGSVKEYLTEMRELLRMREEKDGRRDQEREKSSSSADNMNSSGNKDPDRDDSGKEDKKSTRKLELPIFNGEDPFGWSFRADRYFTINRYQEAEMVEAAAVCMEGRALSWYQWVESRAPFQSWEAFKRALIDRFRPSFKGSAYEALVALKQDGTITEYREQFEANAAPLKDLGEDLLKGIFANGLKEEVKAELRLSQPLTLFGLMDQAHRIEERNWVLEKQKPRMFKNQMGRGEAYSRVSPSPEFSRPNWWNANAKPPDASAFSSNTHKPPERRERAIESAGSINRSDNFRRLSDAELQFKRERGLCYRCDEKFGPNHKCKNRSLQVLLLLEDEEPNPPEMEPENYEDATEEDASKSGVAQETLQNAARRASKVMTEQEARQILGVTEEMPWEEIVKKYDNLFERNAKNGSFYLQSKVHRAKECLEDVYRSKAEGGTPS